MSAESAEGVTQTLEGVTQTLIMICCAQPHSSVICHNPSACEIPSPWGSFPSRRLATVSLVGRPRVGAGCDLSNLREGERSFTRSNESRRGLLLPLACSQWEATCRVRHLYSTLSPHTRGVTARFSYQHMYFPCGTTTMGWSAEGGVTVCCGSSGPTAVRS